MNNNYIEHPWLKDYPVLPEHKHLIIGTHPPMPYTGCMAFYYGNMNEFWRLLETAYKQSLFFDLQGRPDLQRILKWLDDKHVAITDMVNYTISGNRFNTDSDMKVLFQSIKSLLTKLVGEQQYRKHFLYQLFKRKKCFWVVPKMVQKNLWHSPT
jgi:G:T/U-mismatch repair DNA glycosylase